MVKFWMHIPVRGPNCFNFIQFLGKFGKIVCSCPPSPRGGLVSPPRGNRGSATVDPVLIRSSLTGGNLGNFFKPLMRTLQLLVTLCLL